MQIALYQGIGCISKAIRWQTRSKYSHVGMLFSNGSIIEAWVGGIKNSSSISSLHHSGTKVDIFDIDMPNKQKCFNYMHNKIGVGYDYWSIFRFLTRSAKRDLEESLFCSELIFEAVEAGGLKLLERIPARMVSPALLSLSPYLKYVETLVTE